MRLLGILFFPFVCLISRAEVRPARVFGSHMVLQRDQPVPVWGWADAGEPVTVRFAVQEVRVTADASGYWRAVLAPAPAGGPYSMVIRGTNTLVLQDILVGDVWLCSGQSNMEWPVEESNHAAREIAAATDSQIRLFTVPQTMSTTPRPDLSGGAWQVGSPETVGDFSAVGYFFGRELRGQRGVPIGLIHASWGGTRIEPWISPAAMATFPEYRAEVAGLPDFELEKLQKQGEQQFEAWKKSFSSFDRGMRQGRPQWAGTAWPVAGWDTMPVPQFWQNAGLTDLNGVVWFRRTFTLPEKMANQRVVLHLGPIDDSDVAWVNGRKVGETIDNRRAYRVYPVEANLVKTGRNTLVVRIEDYGSRGGMWGKPAEVYLQAGNGRIPLAGTWNYKIGTEALPPPPKRVGPNSKPALLFNAMIHPLIPGAIKGVIWYQGESNAKQAYQYRTLFPRLIEDWRQQWTQGDFPFLFVQLANFYAPKAMPTESSWAELREAQRMALALPRTGMAVAIDIGEANDIHPRNKQEVARRLALAARKTAYGETLVSSGPVYQSMRTEGNKIRLTFDHVGTGLTAKDGEKLTGFAIAAAGQPFGWAEAVIEGNTVVVWSDTVAYPVAVRYAWADNPAGANLYNREGLPASPFRTDERPGLTISSTK